MLQKYLKKSCILEEGIKIFDDIVRFQYRYYQSDFKFCFV